MKKKRINFVHEDEIKNIQAKIDLAKFNKKSKRKDFFSVTIAELCSKKSNMYLTNLEVPMRIAEKAETTRTLFIVPVVRQFVL